jgi:hypothetical protein
MTCVRVNTGWKYCLVGVLGGMGLSILKVVLASPCAIATVSEPQFSQRPLAPVLLAVGGIGGTALDQRQQYTACQPLKKVLVQALALPIATLTWFCRISTSSAV